MNDTEIEKEFEILDDNLCLRKEGLNHYQFSNILDFITVKLHQSYEKGKSDWIKERWFGQAKMDVVCHEVKDYEFKIKAVADNVAHQRDEKWRKAVMELKPREKSGSKEIRVGYVSGHYDTKIDLLKLMND